MEKVDRLSRRLDWKVGIGKDNENYIMINVSQPQHGLGLRVMII